MSKTSRTSPRKFTEKIALLNKKEYETTAAFKRIIEEVERTTRVPQQHSSRHHLHQPYAPVRSSSFSHWQTTSHGAASQPADHFEAPYSSQQTPTYHNYHQARLNAQSHLQAYQQQNQHPNQFHDQKASAVGQQQQQQPPTSYQHKRHHHQSHRQQPIPVPNIAIYSIDDEVVHSVPSAFVSDPFGSRPQLDQCLALATPAPICGTRSMPNISSLSVSSCCSSASSTPPNQPDGIATHYSQAAAHSVVDQRQTQMQQAQDHHQFQPAMSSYGDEQDSLLTSLSPSPQNQFEGQDFAVLESLTSRNSTNEQAHLIDENSMSSEHQQDYCSLPSFSSSATASPYFSSQNQQSHSPGSPQAAQHYSISPSNTNTNHHLHHQQPPSQQQQPQQQQQYLMATQSPTISRSNSTNQLHTNKYGAALEPPRLNGNISKSVEICLTSNNNNNIDNTDNQSLHLNSTAVDQSSSYYNNGQQQAPTDFSEEQNTLLPQPLGNSMVRSRSATNLPASYAGYQSASAAKCQPQISPEKTTSQQQILYADDSSSPADNYYSFQNAQYYKFDG